jgi:hypothetical protein
MASITRHWVIFVLNSGVLKQSGTALLNNAFAYIQSQYMTWIYVKAFFVAFRKNKYQGWRSGLTHWTVNPAMKVFTGSNPVPWI